MKKNLRINKRVLSLLLVFLLSINSFAAIVSDDDGAAFVTKSEFDALKKNFSKQVDDYNKSIDGKIDGAIASYLAGIQLASKIKQECLYEKYKITGTDGILRWTSATDYKINDTNKQKCDYNYKLMWCRVKSDKSSGKSYAESRSCFWWEWQPGYTETRLIMGEDGKITGVAEASYIWSGYMFGLDANYSGGKTNPYYIGNYSGGYPILIDQEIYPSVTKAERSGKAIMKQYGMQNHVYHWNTIWSEKNNYEKNYFYALAPWTTTGTEYYDDKNADVTFYNTGKGKTAVAKAAWNDCRNEPFKFTTTNCKTPVEASWEGCSYVTSGSSSLIVYPMSVECSVFKNDVAPSDFIYSDLQRISDKNGKISNGIVVCTVTESGNLNINYTIDTPGTVYLFLNESSQPYASATQKITSPHTTFGTFSDNLDAKAGESLYVLFKPSDTTIYGTITFNDLSIIKE